MIFPQTPTPAAQESPVGGTADLLGLNSDLEPPAVSSTSSSAPHQGVQGGMKAASSNSDLLNDLFAPPGGPTGAVQEDLFFSGQTSAATPDSKRESFTLADFYIIVEKPCSCVLHILSVLQPWTTCLIRSGWAPDLVSAPAWVRLGRHPDRTCLGTCWVLTVRPPAGSAQLTATPLLLPTPASSTSVSRFATVTSHSIVS